MIAHSEAIAEINMNAEAINLSRWFLKLTVEQYQSSARGHFGFLSSDTCGMHSINIESIGGHLMLQHYHAIKNSDNVIQLVSGKSDLWVFHLIRSWIKVEWFMSIIPKENDCCILKNEVHGSTPSM